MGQSKAMGPWRNHHNRDDFYPAPIAAILKIRGRCGPEADFPRFATWDKTGQITNSNRKLGFRMAVLKLQLLGGFKMMREAGREIVISARKGRALLAMLAVSPSGSVSREKLAALLWSDRGEEQARSSLRQ